MNQQPQPQPRFPCVKVTNRHDGYTFTLDITVNYRDVLQERLRLLQEWADGHTLETATAQINAEGIVCTPQEVQEAIFGSRGLITSTRQSLSPEGNPYRPKSNSRLTRKDSSPFLYDEEGKEWVRGLIREGSAPQRPIKGSYGAIRRLVEARLGLPRYIRHKIGEWDETVDREADLSLPKAK